MSVHSSASQSREPNAPDARVMGGVWLGHTDALAVVAIRCYGERSVQGRHRQDVCQLNNAAYALIAGCPPRCAYSTFDDRSISPRLTRSIRPAIDFPS
jgi:hypothetical protein